MASSHLSPEALSELFEAAVESGLDRVALLAGIHPGFVAQLNSLAAPGPQLYSDLYELNRVGRLEDMSAPLHQWLLNAHTLSRPRSEATTFAKYYHHLSDRLPCVAPTQPPATEALDAHSPQGNLPPAEGSVDRGAPEENARTGVQLEHQKHAHSPPRTARGQEERFAPSITSWMATLKRKVELLTADQIQVLHQLRYRSRALISGCAGSGKTLLVAEKAIRLDAAGMRTLVLCHNPNLARHLRSLVANPSIDVYEISTFVSQLAGNPPSERVDWSAFEEPLDQDLEKAISAIDATTAVYEAVLVDEGQDFRETWWVLVDALLEYSRTKVLYIFYDDNQALLPHRAKYPINSDPVSMSKNCRNGGNVFEVVRRFHRNAPLSSNFLTADGIAKVTPFNERDFRVRLEEALVDAHKHAESTQIRVLTNEPSAELSGINGFEFVRQTEYRWRIVVENDLNALAEKALRKLQASRSGSSQSEIANRFRLPLGRSPSGHLTAPRLSQSILPTEEDIDSVRKFAIRLAPFFGGKAYKTVRFATRNQKLYLAASTHTGKELAANDASKVYHYSSPTWSSSLQAGRPTKLGANLQWPERDVIPLYTVDAFKGLECDALVLVVNLVSHNLPSEMYVGSSRAIGYLHVVISRPALSRLTSLADLDPSILSDWHA